MVRTRRNVFIVRFISEAPAVLVCNNDSTDSARSLETSVDGIAGALGLDVSHGGVTQGSRRVWAPDLSEVR